MKVFLSGALSAVGSALLERFSQADSVTALSALDSGQWGLASGLIRPKLNLAKLEQLKFALPDSVETEDLAGFDTVVHCESELYHLDPQVHRKAVFLHCYEHVVSLARKAKEAGVRRFILLREPASPLSTVDNQSRSLLEQAKQICATELPELGTDDFQVMLVSSPYIFGLSQAFHLEYPLHAALCQQRLGAELDETMHSALSAGHCSLRTLTRKLLSLLEKDSLPASELSLEPSVPELSSLPKLLLADDLAAFKEAFPEAHPEHQPLINLRDHFLELPLRALIDLSLLHRSRYSALMQELGALNEMLCVDSSKIKAHIPDPQALITESLTLLQSGDFLGAEKILDKVQYAEPTPKDYHHCRALVLASRGQNIGARAELECELFLHSDNQDAKNLLELL